MAADGWKNTGAGERHWQGWGIANDKVINPATGRPRSDDAHMNALARRSRLRRHQIEARLNWRQN